MNLKQKNLWHSYLKPEDWFSAADVYVYLVIEGFGTVIIEAAACECPFSFAQRYMDLKMQ